MAEREVTQVIQCPSLHSRWPEVVAELLVAQTTRSSEVWIVVLQRIQRILEPPQDPNDPAPAEVEGTGARVGFFLLDYLV